MSQTKKLKSDSRTILADLCTPVSIYLRVRDRFPNAILLESAEYSSNDDCLSIICCEPIAEFCVRDKTVTRQYGQEETQRYNLDSGACAKEDLRAF